MTRYLPTHIIKFVQDAVQEEEANGRVVDAYTVAERVCQAFPDDGLIVERLVDFMISGSGGARAIELSRPALILEIILPEDAEPEIDLGDIEAAATEYAGARLARS
jgi:hypothetical protein